MIQKIERMKELIGILREASRAYYAEDREIMSNFEYDRLYDELQKLEQETKLVLTDSPTSQVGYEAVEELPREAHAYPMLSLDKTKDVETLREFAGDHKTLLSWKMDGLTIVLTYRGGRLEKAVTRGNGVIGEVITGNARVFKNIPLQIPYEGELVLRGEAIITYKDFEKINEELPETEARYKNPRNLCSGSVRQLNNEITAKRNVRFYAFSLVTAEGVDFEDSHEKEFLWLKSQGFEVVEYRVVTADTLDDAMDYFREAIQNNPFPSDGLVALYDSVSYGSSLGRTAKFPRNALAFKWADEIRETRLLEVEWSPSRTGLINPVAIFEPVEVEGTTVSRASVHNVSIVKELALGEGDTITVYKANMIIPQIAENLTRSGTLRIPDTCPSCGGPTHIRSENDTEVLCCDDPQCPAKRIKGFTLFVSRDAMNIDGLSEATMEKLLARGFIHEYADLYRLERYRAEIIAMDGFGQRSFDNLMAGIERSRTTTPARVLYSLGIPNVGLANARLLCSSFEDDLDIIRKADAETISSIPSIGPVIAGSIVSYFADRGNNERLDELLGFLTLVRETKKEEEGSQPLVGKTFVITGSVEHFANRSELKRHIEERGGKVTGSVTGKTNYLINNDSNSNSTKNRKAKELGVAVITEQDYLEMIKEA